MQTAFSLSLDTPPAMLKSKPTLGKPSTHRSAPKAPKLVTAPCETAREAIGLLTPGCRILGLTKGQFSAIDVMQVVLDQIGPADVAISTWNTGIRDAQHIGFLRESNLIRSVQLLLDYSFPKMRADEGNMTAVTDAFHTPNIRVARNHSKFMLLRNERWNIAVRSSMNLNRNPRCEQFDLDDDLLICDWLARMIDEIFGNATEGAAVPMREVNQVFAASLGGGLSNAYALASGEDDDAGLRELLRQMQE